MAAAGGAAAGPAPAAVGSYRRTTDFRVSLTDPDATPMRTGTERRLGYHDHYVVDGGKARIILAALVTPADVMENVPLRDLLWRVCFRRKLRPGQVTGDTTYGTVENIVAVEDAGIRAFFPLPDFDRRTPFFGKRDVHLRRRARRVPLSRGKLLPRPQEQVHRADVHLPGRAATCNACPLKAACTASDHGRQVKRSLRRGVPGDECAATTRPRPTRRRCASARSGSSRSLPRRRSGTAYGGSGCAACSTRTSRGC